jgi:hypothetical protein
MAEITPVHSFVDPRLNYSFAANYDLSIRIVPDGFSYAVFDQHKKKYIALESFRFDLVPELLNAFGSNEYIKWLEQILEKRVLLKEKFSRIFIISGGIKYTLMPQPLFQPANARKYLEFVHPISEKDQLGYDEIKAPESCLIQVLPDLLSSWIAANFTASHIFHPCAVMIRNFLIRFKGGSPATRIMANVQTDVLDIIIFRDSVLRFCNSFYYSNHNDLLYYLLFVIEQLKISAEDLSLYLSGAVESHSELNKLLNSYIRYVDLIPQAPGSNFSPSLNLVPQQRYFDLLNVSLCV